MVQKLLFSIFLILQIYSQAQSVKVTYPSERMVLQRNNSNTASVFVAGTFNGLTDQIDARLVAINGGTSTDWVTIEFNPIGGVFRGVINATGGWYQLEVRQILDNNVTATTTVNKFGVGEVFIIAGQSNAQGFKNFGNAPATDDRVQHISNNYNESGSDQIPPYPTFDQLQANSNIAPFGQGSWCYGTLGDLLTQRLNVPVLFINAGWEASTVDDWVESSNGGVRFNIFSGNIFPKGMPYANLRNSLLNYGSITGFRSIIWHQGESDTEINTNSAGYINSLSKLIELTRNSTGKNISWLVCKVSRLPNNKTSSQVIDAQNNIVFQLPNVFAGPNTDVITERFDGVHFSGNGLVQFANGLNNSLNNNFFANSVPQPASDVVKVFANCDGSSIDQPIRLTISDGLRDYNINQVDTKSTLVGKELIIGRGRDSFGNWIYTSPVDFRESSFFSSKTPIISASGPTSFCPGGSVILSSNFIRSTFWNDQTIATPKIVNSAGIYTSYFFNEFGCPTKSNDVEVKIFEAPSVSVLAENLSFCSGDEITLTSSQPIVNVWSSGETTQSIKVSKSGVFSVKTTNQFGCDGTSNLVTTRELPKASQPVILADSLNQCEGKSLVLTSSNSDFNIWSTGETTRSITVFKEGEYTLKTNNTEGCISGTATVATKQLPKAQMPTIIPDSLSFCSGKSIFLTSTSTQQSRWSTGETTRSIKVSTSGEFKLKSINQYGCESDENAIKVEVLPIPEKPTITADSLSFCPGKSVKLSSNAILNNWNTGDTSKTIEVNKAGTYVLKTLNNRGCISPEVSVNVSVLPRPVPPIITANGPIIFCEGESVELVSSGASSYAWNNGSISQKIISKQSGNYSLTIVDKNGCTSLASKPITVNSKPIPNTPSVIQIGTFTLEVLSDGIKGEVFEWKFGNEILPFKTPSIKANKPGVYTVKSIVQYNLPNVKTFSCPSATSENFNFTADIFRDGMSVYPNPSLNGVVFIETQDDVEEAEISLTTIKGITLFSVLIPKMSSRQVFDFSEYPHGLYLLRIKGKSYDSIRRILLDY